MRLALVVALALSAQPPSKTKVCEDRCAASTKPCTETCDKTYPKEKAKECRTACQQSVPACKEYCQNGGPKEDDR